MNPVDPDLWHQVLIILGIIGIVVTILRWRHPLRIVIEEGHVKSHTGIAKAQVRRVVDFIEKDLAPNGKITVLGARDARGNMRFTFRGDIDEGTCQRIRNYLKMTL